MGVVTGVHSISIGNRIFWLAVSKHPSHTESTGESKKGTEHGKRAEVHVFSLWEFEATGYQDSIHILEAATWGNEGFVSAAS